MAPLVEKSPATSVEELTLRPKPTVFVTARVLIDVEMATRFWVVKEPPTFKSVKIFTNDEIDKFEPKEPVFFTLRESPITIDDVDKTPATLKFERAVTVPVRIVEPPILR